MPDYTIVVSTYAGLEELLAKELQSLGGRDTEIHTRAVSCIGDTGFIYKVNFSSRLALRVMINVVSFDIRGDRDLYEKVKEIEWDQYLNVKQTFSVRCTMNSDMFTNNLYPALKAKDAIADYFRDKTGSRPDVDKDNADMQVSLFIHQHRCTVQLNSSGQSLHLRGYREDAGKAPLSEVLAAGLVMLSGWEPHRALIDFMCGSGTILIEAALIAGKIPPGVFRKNFAFQKWPDYDADLYQKIRESQIERISDVPVRLFGNDIQRQMIQKAQANITGAGVEDMIDLTAGDYRSYEPPASSGVVIVNPPYGEKLQLEDHAAFYKEIGDTLKKKYSGFDAWIFTGTPEAFKWVGLRPSRKIALFNGPIECRFLKYELFAGSKKDKYTTEG